MAASTPPTTVVLVGMMGSGKTTVGAALADRSGWPYLDNDELVRRATGREPKDIDAADGEAVLHVAEAAALHHALKLPPPLIVGAAAWVVTDPASSGLMRAPPESPSPRAIVVYLRARPETLRARVGAGQGRRADAVDLDWLRARFEERDEVYREIASFTVDTDDLAPDAIAQRILDRLAP